jgi:hypothetical protein
MRRHSARPAIRRAMVALTIAGCNGSTPEADLSGYALIIPAEVPERVVLHDKNGTQRVGKGRELYARGHKQGWRDCWEGTRKGWTHLDDELDWQRFVPQDDSTVQSGFQAGFMQCQKLLRSQR